jgi:hypothetical protein
MRFRHFSGSALALGLVLGGESQAQLPAGWQVEPGADRPTFATMRPIRSNRTLDALVLNCHEAGDTTVLQLEVYPPDFFLQATERQTPVLREGPKVRAVIDGKPHPASLYMAGEYAVIADSIQGRSPALSRQLLDALEQGRELVLQFAMFAEPVDPGSRYDVEATIDLQAGMGGAAVAAVRRCAMPAVP